MGRAQARTCPFGAPLHGCPQPVTTPLKDVTPGWFSEDMPSSTALLAPRLAADAPGSYDARVSAATVDDLTLIESESATLEASRRRIVLALARVADRRDGEAAVGMPMRQHLTVVTKQARGAIAAMQTVADVIHDLPTILAAWQAGEVSFDQVKACLLYTSPSPRD